MEAVSSICKKLVYIVTKHLILVDTQKTKLSILLLFAVSLVFSCLVQRTLGGWMLAVM